jgi:hypothetical protein
VNLNHSLGGPLEKLSNLVADCRGRLLLGEKQARAQEENRRERDERALRT